MKKAQFKYFSPYFTPEENWGDFNKIHWWHIKHLFDVRMHIKTPMNIHCSYEVTGHSNGSYHYKGMATDFHFVTGVPLIYQYKAIKKTLVSLDLWGFVGLGVYPEWTFPGFHFDGRGSGLKWVRANGIYYYGENKVYEFFTLKDGEQVSNEKK